MAKSKSFESWGLIRFVEKVVGRVPRGRCASDYMHIERKLTATGESRWYVDAIGAGNTHATPTLGVEVVACAEIATSGWNLPEVAGEVVGQNKIVTDLCKQGPVASTDKDSWIYTKCIDPKQLRVLLEVGSEKAKKAPQRNLGLVALWVGSDGYLSVGSTNLESLVIAVQSGGSVSAPKRVCLVPDRVVRAMVEALKFLGTSEGGVQVTMWRNEQERLFGVRLTLEVDSITLSVTGFCDTTEVHPLEGRGDVVPNLIALWKEAVSGNSFRHGVFSVQSTYMEEVTRSLKTRRDIAKVSSDTTKDEILVFFQKESNSSVFVELYKTKTPPLLLEGFVLIGRPNSFPVRVAFNLESALGALTPIGRKPTKMVVALSLTTSNLSLQWGQAPLCVAIDGVEGVKCMRLLAAADDLPQEDAAQYKKRRRG